MNLIGETMKCKICGDPIKKCNRKETNNWCHTWHHEHRPKPENNIQIKEKNMTYEPAEYNVTKQVEKSFLGNFTGRNDAVFLRNRYQTELDNTWAAIVNMVHYLEDKISDLEYKKNHAESTKHIVEAKKKERNELFNELKEAIEKETGHEFKMWETTTKQQPTNIVMKTNMKYSDADEINYNSLLNHVKHYPYSEKISQLSENIESKESDLKEQIKIYHIAIQDYHTLQALFDKDTPKSGDKIQAYKNILEKGNNEIEKCGYKDSIFYRLNSLESKNLVCIDTIKHRVSQFEHTLEIIRKKHSNIELNMFEKMNYD